ncbi:hypothetical protein NBX26_02495 [Mesomycoplasma hyopneumoniae]|uniref:MPN499 family protein n=1 Tax=Mesomycoplasma hyopneumoniae TaxID=2099 RepID=UPI00385736B4
MTNLASFLNNFQKVKINHFVDGYWLVPSFWKIFSPRLTGYVIKKEKSLAEIVENNNLLQKEIIFSFNGDHNFYNFNIALKLRGIDFYLDRNALKNKADNEFFVFYPVKECKIVLDKRSLELIYQGIIPFFSKNYYQKMLEFQREYIKKNQISKEFKGFFWRRMGYKEIYE